MLTWFNIKWMKSSISRGVALCSLEINLRQNNYKNVLETVFIFIPNLFLVTIIYLLFSLLHHHISYQILNPRGIKGNDDPKKCSKILLESTELDQDSYRIGNTKACYHHNIYYSLLHNTMSLSKQKHLCAFWHQKIASISTGSHLIKALQTVMVSCKEI